MDFDGFDDDKKHTHIALQRDTDETGGGTRINYVAVFLLQSKCVWRWNEFFGVGNAEKTTDSNREKCNKCATVVN